MSRAERAANSAARVRGIQPTLNRLAAIRDRSRGYSARAEWQVAINRLADILAHERAEETLC